MARETTIYQRTGVSKRTMNQANRNLTGSARLRSAIYNRAYNVAESARNLDTMGQYNAFRRINRAMNSMLRRNNLAESFV